MFLLTFLVLSCSGTNDVPIPPQSLDAETTSFEVDVPVCDTPVDLTVIETNEEVRVRIRAATNPSCGAGCAEIVTVNLEAPLGNRRLIDDSTDLEVERI